MNDDFNTALASAALFDMAREINTYLKQDVLDKAALQKAADVYIALLNIMGLDFSADNSASDGLVDDLMNLLIGGLGCVFLGQYSLFFAVDRELQK